MNDPSNNPPADENERLLIANVHPPGWVNPEPRPRYNLVVIGAGPAGLVAASGAAALGAQVALVEKNRLGGDCLNFGCVPSKGIIRAGRAIRDARNAAEFGVINGDRLKVDFGAAFERMRQVRARISDQDSARRLSGEKGIDLFFGAARFTGADTLEVEGATLSFHRAAICTGSSPYVPPIPGLAEAGFLTNETVFSLTALPERLAVIGGGPLGCELAQAFAHLGSTVFILHSGSRLLPREDPETSAVIHNALERDGILVYQDAKILEIETCGALKNLVFEEGEGNRRTLQADSILVGTGRRPNVSGMDLDKAAVESDPVEGIQVNSRLRTGNPRIYAAGDVCSRHKFTHAADAMARIVIANALFGARQTASGLVIPRCTYTTPEAAHVGLGHEEAVRGQIAIDTFSVSLAEVDRALLEGEDQGFVTVHLKKGTDRILGATIVARHAGELINEFTLAINAGIGLGTIAATIHPYPTLGEAIKKLADAYNRTRLTPGLKRMLAAWQRWKRS
ncbi:MAG: mercuric reductase [Deltaproteobacteria bacterium]|nr:mercuric reductase [Deltaproteobacteria bacterium]